MSADSIAALRNVLHAFVDAAGQAVTTKEIVVQFRERHRAEIEAAAEALHGIALTKLVDEVSRRRHKVGSTGQGDLFLGASSPTSITVEIFRDGRVRHLRKPFETVTIREAQAYLDRKPKVRKPKPDAGVVAILARIAPHVTSPDQTIGEALAALEAAEASAAAAG